jgi:hypothetical protein
MEVTHAHGFEDWTADLARPERLAHTIRQGGRLTGRAARHLALGAIGAALFGLALGSFGLSPPQMLASALKSPLLLVGAGALCFPTFYALQLLRAAEPMPLAAAFALQAAAAAAAGAVWGGFALPLAFLVTTTHHYQLSQSMALIVGALGGLSGARRLGQLYRAACDDRPLKSLTVTVPWAILYSAVGAQLAWMMRPFIGSPELGFQLLRPIEGNMFSAIVRILG